MKLAFTAMVMYSCDQFLAGTDPVSGIAYQNNHDNNHDNLCRVLTVRSTAAPVGVVGEMETRVTGWNSNDHQNGEDDDHHDHGGDDDDYQDD